MIKGYIESIEEGAVTGWAFSTATNLTGAAILAFDGDRCIGAGEIGAYRSDLESVGLGDGCYGFSIGCDPAVLAASKRISVRLADSDFLLPWNGSAAAAEPDSAFLRRFIPFSTQEDERLAWMSAHGWFSNEQFALARALNNSGYYIRTFSQPELKKSRPVDVLTPLLSDTLSAMYRRDLPAASFAYVHGGEILPRLTQVRQQALEEQFVALFGGALSVGLLQGAQLGCDTAGDAPAQVVKVSGYQAVICHANCLREFVADEPAAMTLLYLSRAGS